MIRLREDCLIFRTGDGQTIPCTAEEVTIEIMGDAAGAIDPDVVRSAAAAVLHYFKTELGREEVSVSEFSLALERILRGFGFQISYADKPADGSVTESAEAKAARRIAEADLVELAADFGPACELFFFQKLRENLKATLAAGPDVVRFSGLRGCAKRLTGSRRWSHRCEEASDRIVGFLRESFSRDNGGHRCALVVS
jgi:hypothetical protein